jgi:hypothetical protein
VDNCHSRGKKVGVWIDKSVTTEETIDLWHKVMDLDVDFICTDYPLEMIQARDDWIRMS